MGMTQQQLRLILRNVLGDFGNPITEAGEIQQVDDGEGNNVNAPANPSLLDRLTTMRRKTETTRPPGPEVFRGTSAENPRLWRIKMRDYLNHAGYPAGNEVERLRVIKMFLADQALIWFEALPAAQKNTQVNFWAAFDANYFGHANQYALQQTLISRKQKPGEAVETYIMDVTTKANQLDWDQNRTVAHLIAGLTSKLKPFVLMKNPETLPDTVRAIEMAEQAASSQGAELETIQNTLKEIAIQMKTEKEEKKVAPVVPVEQPATVNYMAPQYSQPPQQGYNMPYQSYNQQQPRYNNQQRGGKRNGNRNNNNRRQERPVIKVYNNYGRRQQGRGGQQNNQSRQNPGNGPTCWQCGSPNHFRAECPQYKQSNQGAGRQRGQGRPNRNQEN